MTEPLTRESVLAVLDKAVGVTLGDQGLRETRAAVAALYERCEALERAGDKKNETMKAVAKYLGHQKFGAYVGALQNAINFTGTEPSDAEGGG